MRRTFARSASNYRRQVHGVDYLDLRVRERDLADGGENVFHRLAVVLPAVAGHSDDLFGKVDILKLGRCKAAVADSIPHSVDNGVAGDENVALHGLTLEVVGVVRRRREVQRGNAADE